MSAPVQLTKQAVQDLKDIWWFIARQDHQAADRVEMEIVSTCSRIAKYPLIGHCRRDITPLPVRFWTLTKFPNYIIVYRPDSKPLQVVAILHAKRNLEETLKQRLP
jgi:plasmid stabilization system protein ParE